MEHKSKEKILAKYVRCECWPANDGGKPVYNSSCPRHSTDPESAMDDWAEQVAISFAEWIADNEYQYNEVRNFWEGYDRNDAGCYGLKFLCNTTAELYALFLIHQSI